MSVTALRTARVPAPLAGRQRVRPALERWLAGVDLARHGLPPQAILLARRLQAGWPELAAADAAGRYRSLAALVGCARRPAHGESGGEAVWFADEAELLACLARDAATGALAWRWWWRLVLRAPTAAAARERWCEAPRAVPQALARMGEEEARAWLDPWPESERAAIHAQLASVFPIAPPVRASGAVSAPGRGRAANSQSSQSASLIAPGMEPPSPRGAHDLATLALALARDPLATSTRAPAQPRRRERASPPPPGAQLAASAPARVVAANGVADTPPDAGAGRSQPEPAPSPAVAVQATRAERMPRPAKARRTHADVPKSGGREEGAAVQEVPAARPAQGRRAVTQPTSPDRRPSAPLPEPAAALWLSTGFGGLPLLLNVALELGLYGDFTQPRHAGLPCSPWRFLLAAGTALGGRTFGADPLACWLRERDAARQARRSRPWTALCAEVLRADCARNGIRLESPSRSPWPWLRARLARALDAPPAQVVGLLLRLPARLHDQGERLDLHFELADLPLAVRLAGLDRDPGWIPAAACDLRLHFH